MFDEFNKIFSENIIQRCKGKKILLTLSGGMDTRAILSVLCKNNIPIDVFTIDGWNNKQDVDIAKQLVDYVEIVDKHIIWKSSNLDDIWMYQDSLFKQYDVVLRGFFMSELFNKYENIHKGENFTLERIEDCSNRCKSMAEKYPMIYQPAYDDEVQKQLSLLPIMYRCFSSIQRKIIMLNQPDLLSFPLTCYSFKIRFVRWMYWFFIDVFEKYCFEEKT
jgi:hypothetical protein